MRYQGKEIRVVIVFPVIETIQVGIQRNLKLESVVLEGLEYGLDEINQIASLLNAETLIGKRATLHNLLDMLEPGCDIVWLITHATEAGWYLTDGLVDAAETTAILRSCGAFLTVMNTCSSIEVARQSAKEIGSAFICTVKEVPDRKAFITGVLFAQKLAAGFSYQEAYALAKPGQNRLYELIEARQMPQRDGNQDFFDKSMMVDPETLMRFIKSVEEMNIILNGSPKLGVLGVRSTLLTLEGDVKKALGEIVAIKAQYTSWRWIAWGSAIGLLIVLITQALLLFLVMSR